jgi:multimeric flavodoxin WrbA
MGDALAFSELINNSRTRPNFVMEKILAADGIILSSPNYITNVTAQLKTLFDRSPLMVHEQLFEGKYGFSLTTAGSSEIDFVLDIMNNYTKTCGGNTIGGVGCAMSQGPSALETAIVKSVSSSNCMVNFSAMKLTKKFIAPL